MVGMNSFPDHGAMDMRRRSNSGHQSLRKGRSSGAGMSYLVTFTTHHRERLFEDPLLAMKVSACMASVDAWKGAKLYAWVLMPDHAHAVIELEKERSLETIVKRAKALTALTCNRYRETLGHVWSKAFHDRELRGEFVIADAIAYVVHNPVRAGLAGDIGAYPFWGCAAAHLP